jgi:outer membrane lipoprotein-sorting protein
MKKLILSLLAIASFSLSFAQTAEEIVNKHIEAIGGADNWKKINSLVMEASIKAQGAEIKLTRTHLHNKAMRMDIAVMGMNGYSIITQKEGWNFMPFQGQTKYEAMTPDDVKSSQDELSILDEFITYKDLGKKLEYLGKDDLEGTECFKLKLTDKEGEEITYWLDPTNYYTLKQSQKVKANGKEMESVTTFSNYKNIEEGIVYAFSLGGDWGDTEINKITINPKIDESIFKPTN